jgi:glutaredoxin-related protein
MLLKMSRLNRVAEHFDLSNSSIFISYEDLKAQVKKSGIPSKIQYKKHYKDFKHWPSHPEKTYKEWKDWNNFFGKDKAEFVSYKEFKTQVKQSSVSSVPQYKKQYKNFKGWPSNPNIVYKKEWKGWLDLFDRKKDFLSYEDLKLAVKKAKILTAKQYRRYYKNFERWPSNPQRSYKEWKGWPSLFDKR